MQYQRCSKWPTFLCITAANEKQLSITILLNAVTIPTKPWQLVCNSLLTLTAKSGTAVYTFHGSVVKIRIVIPHRFCVGSCKKPTFRVSLHTTSSGLGKSELSPEDIVYNNTQNVVIFADIDKGSSGSFKYKSDSTRRNIMYLIYYKIVYSVIVNSILYIERHRYRSNMKNILISTFR